MQQQYDNLQAKNLSQGRSSDVLAAIKTLEDEGFYQGNDNIDCDIKTVITHGEWEIKCGYSDTYLYITVALPNGSRWVADLKSCEDEFPSYKQILNGNPAALSRELAAIKQKKYERMMQAITWVKDLLEPPSLPPSSETISTLIDNGFHCFGSKDDVSEMEADTFLEAYEANIKDWHLSCHWRQHGWILLNATHKSNQLWQTSFRKDDLSPHECFESMKKLFLEL